MTGDRPFLPPFTAAFAKATAGQVRFICRGEAFRRNRGGMSGEARRAKTDEGGMHQGCPLRSAARSTSPVNGGGKQPRGIP